jgi:uridine monophosphate synthetase
MSTHLISALLDKNMIKLGQFTLKSGKVSPIYINLREMIAYPKLLTQIADTIYAQKPEGFKPDLICGVPYSALTLMAHLSIQHNLPMILKRKEAKAYGTKQLLEGIFSPGMNCVVIEDVVTTGQSTIETINELRAAGLVVTEVLVLIDREQGAKESFAKAHVNYHAAFTLKEILDEMVKIGRINATERQEIAQQLN